MCFEEKISDSWEILLSESPAMLFLLSFITRIDTYQAGAGKHAAWQHHYHNCIINYQTLSFCEIVAGTGCSFQSGERQFVSGQENVCCLISAWALQAPFCEFKGGSKVESFRCKHCTFLPTLSHIARLQGHSKDGMYISETPCSRTQILEEPLLKQRGCSLMAFHHAGAAAKSWTRLWERDEWVSN